MHSRPRVTSLDRKNPQETRPSKSTHRRPAATRRAIPVPNHTHTRTFMDIAQLVRETVLGEQFGRIHTAIDTATAAAVETDGVTAPPRQHAVDEEGVAPFTSPYTSTSGAVVVDAGHVVEEPVGECCVECRRRGLGVVWSGLFGFGVARMDGPAREDGVVGWNAVEAFADQEGEYACE